MIKIELIQGNITTVETDAIVNAAKIAVETVRNFSFQSLEEVIFVCFDEENYKEYQTLLSE